MKVKTIFILPNLMAGGAERVFSFIPQHLDPKIFETQILVVGHRKDSVYSTGDVKVTYLEKDRLLNGIAGIYKFIRKEKPDVILGSISHLNLVLSLLKLLFPKVKVAVREASVVSVMNRFSTAKYLPFSDSIFKIAYKKADAIICQSYDMAQDFSSRYGIPSSKIVRIGNPITNLEYRASTSHAKSSHQNNTFITVGRLSKEKGHKRILNLLSKSGVDFMYTIVGDGPERDNIQQQIKDLGIEDCINHIPHTKNVSELLKKNDLFIQGSYVEGFPNAVLESCTVGTPVLAFNVPGGTKEVIQPGINGFLPENEEEFMKYLTYDHNWDKQKISMSVINKYGPKVIVSKYENLLIKLTK